MGLPWEQLKSQQQVQLLPLTLVVQVQQVDLHP